MRGSCNKISSKINTIPSCRFAIVDVASLICVTECENVHGWTASDKQPMSSGSSKVSEDTFDCLLVVFLWILHKLAGFVYNIGELGTCDEDVLKGTNNRTV